MIFPAKPHAVTKRGLSFFEGMLQKVNNTRVNDQQPLKIHNYI